MTPPRPSIADKRRTFAQLHESGCFAIPNPFDVGSALFLQSLRFKAIATTSSGFAWTIGQADNQVSREAVLTHLAAIVDATDIPVNADFESGFGTDAGGVGESVRLAVATGIAGLSIEDSTGIAARPLYAIDEAVARVRAARRAIDQAGGDTLLVGRAECFLVGHPDLAETIARRCSAAAGPRVASLSKPNAPIARCRSAAEMAAAPIALIRSNTVAIGGPGGVGRFCPTGGTGSDRIEANSSAGGMPPRTCAAAVAPDDVPITRSAASVISMPASASPAMTPIVHACPADPPPPRTRATFLTICALLQPVDTPVHRDIKTVPQGRFRGSSR